MDLRRINYKRRVIGNCTEAFRSPAREASGQYPERIFRVTVLLMMWHCRGVGLCPRVGGTDRRFLMRIADCGRRLHDLELSLDLRISLAFLTSL